MSKTIDFYQKIRDGKYDKYKLTAQGVKEIGDKIGVDWSVIDFGQFMQGVKEELEHGCTFAVADDPNQTNVTSDDLTSTAKIALAHLYEVTDYYTRLEILENEGEAHWEEHNAGDWIQQNYKQNKDVLEQVGL